MSEQSMLIADLTHRHLGKMVRIASEDKRFGIAGVLDEVHHVSGGPARLWIQVTPENNVEVHLVAGTTVAVMVD